MPKREPQGCLFGWLLDLFEGAGNSEPTEPQLPYRGKDYFFSQAERAFYSVLSAVVTDEYVLFAKVRLADILFVEKGTGAWQSHFNRIQSKHVDFVLCTKDVIRPVLVVELDDKSHERNDRRERDAFVDQALTAAGIPILHVKARGRYNDVQLRTEIRNCLERAPSRDS